MSLSAVVLATIIILLAMPAFNNLIGQELKVDPGNPGHFIFLVSIGLVCGVLSGIYPAFYLSSFKPALVLKGLKIKNSGASVFMRKGLVILQFSISIILIISTIIIHQQVNHVKSRNLGYETRNIIQTPVPRTLPGHFSAIRNELLQSGSVENAALCWSEPLHMYTSANDYSWEGKSPEELVQVYDMGVSSGYVSTMRIKVLAGRDFYPEEGKDSNSVIINASLAKLMGEHGKIGAYLSKKSPSIRVEIVGIIDDFVFNDMYGAARPAAILCLPQATNMMLVKFKESADLRSALEKTDAIIKASTPGYPFEYKFVDDAFNKLFESETLIGKLSTVFSILAIVISCLGLFGLAAYTAERRTKEIGIRKVLGARVSTLTRLLSLEFLKLVCLSCIIAFPVAWWGLHGWLNDFEYRTTIQWWVFLVAGFLALSIALLTVSYQAIKIAIINPVRSLRAE
jgi:hypothetical protein